MLRIRVVEPLAVSAREALGAPLEVVEPRPDGALVAAAPQRVEIIRDFDDPYLELIRLLREASEIEHALLVQYLYAVFSVNGYPEIKGFALSSPRHLLGVAIQEMEHLDVVNRMLVSLGATPNLTRQDFPYESDIYPFPLNLEPLSPQSLAKYVYTEAPAAALDREDPANAGDREFLDRLFAVLGDVRPNHLGSLYKRIIDVTNAVIAAPPPGLPDLSQWPPLLEAVKGEGEVDHFHFFRDVFMGTHPGFGGRDDIWTLAPSDPAYPSLPLPVNPSALEGHPGQIEDEELRAIARVGNLHYWLICGLLDLAYRYEVGSAAFLSRRHMTGPLNMLGTHLASFGQGLPFDPLSMGYALGSTQVATVRILRQLVLETEAATERVRHLLPPNFPFRLTQQTLAELTAMLPDDIPEPQPPAPQPAPPADANEFWFQFDDRFAFNPTPEIIRAYEAIGGLDFILTRFQERRAEGEYPDGFEADVRPTQPGLEVLSREQLAIITRHFGDDLGARQRTFEDFGQGVLFDDRRPPGRKVHMMDVSGISAPIGYHRWHAIIRAMILLDIDAGEWAEISRLVALAWAIHAAARPRQDTHNPPLPDSRLAELRAIWLAASTEQLDAAFDNLGFPPS